MIKKHFLQIWLAPSIPLWRLDCMKFVWRFIGKDDDYTIICNYSKLFDDAPGRTQFLKPGELLSGWKNKPDHGHWMDYSRDNRFFSDYVRLMFACNTPNLFYIDTDIKLGILPDFEKQGAYIGKCNRFDFGDFDIFFVNNDTDFFKNFMTHCKNKKNVFIPFELRRREIIEQYNLFSEGFCRV